MGEQSRSGRGLGGGGGGGDGRDVEKNLLYYLAAFYKKPICSLKVSRGEAGLGPVGKDLKSYCLRRKIKLDYHFKDSVIIFS